MGHANAWSQPTRKLRLSRRLAVINTVKENDAAQDWTGGGRCVGSLGCNTTELVPRALSPLTSVTEFGPWLWANTMHMAEGTCSSRAPCSSPSSLDRQRFGQRPRTLTRHANHNRTKANRGSLEMWQCSQHCSPTERQSLRVTVVYWFHCFWAEETEAETDLSLPFPSLLLSLFLFLSLIFSSLHLLGSNPGSCLC